jgi:hypothetical protein
LPRPTFLSAWGAHTRRYSERPKGLLLKILETIQKPCNEGNHQVFMASAVEGYLRGAPLLDRMFLLDHGLLGYIFGEMLGDGENRPQGLLQSLFDLLGEVLKFSPSVHPLQPALRPPSLSFVCLFVCVFYLFVCRFVCVCARAGVCVRACLCLCFLVGGFAYQSLSRFHRFCSLCVCCAGRVCSS